MLTLLAQELRVSRTPEAEAEPDLSRNALDLHKTARERPLGSPIDPPNSRYKNWPGFARYVFYWPISLSSTRRLRARPSAVALDAIGCEGPYPAALTREPSTPRPIRYSRTATARACESCMFFALFPDE